LPPDFFHEIFVAVVWSLALVLGFGAQILGRRNSTAAAKHRHGWVWKKFAKGGFAKDTPFLKPTVCPQNEILAKNHQFSGDRIVSGRVGAFFFGREIEGQLRSKLIVRLEEDIGYLVWD